MKFSVNIKARLERHARNAHVFQKNNVLRTVKQFKIFSLVLMVILPVYPSFGAVGGITENSVGNYDESTILVAYEDDSVESDLFSSESGFLKAESDLDAKRNTIGVNRLIPYAVQDGESYASIALKFRITPDSIMWANGTSRGGVLKPGQIIKIPPVSGLAYTVQSGDTIEKIANTFKITGEKIAKQNRLALGQELLIGQELIIPGAIRDELTTPNGGKNAALVAGDTKKTAKNTKPSLEKGKKPSGSPEKAAYAIKYTGNGRGFAWGNCTYYVANHKNVTWRGNANQWLRNARAAGVPTGSNPAIGAIISLSGYGYNPYYGHVGIVVDIDGDDIIVKDMNYRRLNEVTIRRISKSDDSIRGYIYVD